MRQHRRPNHPTPAKLRRPAGQLPPAGASAKPATDTRPLGVVSALVAVALLALAAMGGGAEFAADHANLLAVFLTGLVSGGLTCLAVQGGLLTTAIAQPALANGAAQTGRATPIVWFLAAKLTAYTALGALLGWLGAAVGFSLTLQGWVQIAIGVYLLGVAAHLLNLHPIFRWFDVQPPRFVLQWLRAESKSGRGGWLAPATLGALTVLIPCGTTQAMMIAAVGTGSPIGGALTLFAFVLGTSPLFFALGYLATRLSEAWRGRFYRIAAIAIAAMAVFSFTGGLALLDAPLAVGLAAEAPIDKAAPVGAAPMANTVMMTDSGEPIQQLVIRAEPTRYAPNRLQVKAGSPARVKVVTGPMLGCTRVFTIPSLRVVRVLPANGEATIDLPTDQPGQIRFTCGMGMYSGVIDVVS